MKITRTAAAGVLAALALAAAGCSSADSAKPATATTAASSSRSSAAASSARATATGTAPAAATYKPWADPSNGNTCTYVHPETGGFEVALLMQGTLQYPSDPTVCYSALNAELAKYDQGAGDTLPGTWTYQPGAAPVTVGGCNGTVGDVTVTIGLAGRAVMNDTNLISAPGYPQAENDSSYYCGAILNPYG